MNDCAFTHGPSKSYCQFCLVKGCNARMYPDDTHNIAKPVVTTNHGLETLQEEKNKDGIFLTGPEIGAIQCVMRMYWTVYNAVNIMGESQIILANHQLLSIEKKIEEYNKQQKKHEENNV